MEIAPLETTEIAMPDGGMAEAYLARPSAEGLTAQGDVVRTDLPGVLFYMDAIGLRPRIEQMAQRIADWGYVVLAPNVFFREGLVADLAPQRDLTEPGAREEFFALASPRVKRLGAEQAARDIPAYLKALRDLTGVSRGAIGTTGYCMGARLAVRTANLDPDVAAVGGFHGGGLVNDAEDSPHRGLGRARAEFVFGHADRDQSMPPEAVAALGEALRSAGLVASNEIYLDAAHGYTMSDTAMYDEAATERHFAELEALFARRLNPCDGA